MRKINMKWFGDYVFSRNKRIADKKGIKYLFCINSGRAGSEYFSTLLGTASEVMSYHEPEPQMIGPYLREVAKRGMEDTFEMRRIKSRSIAKLVRKFPAGSVYAETNHMFIKTFYDVVLRDFKDVAVVYLYREFLDTLKSFVQLCYFSKENETWPNWMISPNSVTSKIDCIDRDDSLDYIDLSIAYLIDIEARANYFEKNNKNIKYYRVDLRSLNDESFCSKMFDDLGITFTRETSSVIGNRINRRDGIKVKYGNVVDESYLSERVRKYISRGLSQGIEFPERILEYY